MKVRGVTAAVDINSTGSTTLSVFGAFLHPQHVPLTRTNQRRTSAAADRNSRALLLEKSTHELMV